MERLTLLEALTLMASGKEVTLKFEAPASEFTVADLIKLESEGAKFFIVPETVSNPEQKMSFAEMLGEEPPVPAITSPPNAEEQKATGKRKKIDRGKVWALHNAGWKNKEIAEEVGCSEWSICQILKEEE